MTRARLIVNPSAGKDRALPLLPVINERLRTLVDDLDITMTTAAEDVEHAAARAMTEGYQALYVAGGDGTLNVVLRGLAGVVGRSPIPIGIIPLGTGNDFAKSLGLGEEPEAALDLLLDGRTVDVDVGMLNDRPFANTSAGGFVADVSEAVSEELKDIAGKAAYLIGGVRVLLGAEPFAVRFRAASGSHGLPPMPTEAIEVQMFAVCNGRFIGGGNPIAPLAIVDDGLLDVLVVPRMSLLDFVAVLQRIGAGEQSQDGVLQFRAPEFDLEFDRMVRVNTDGEVLEADRCHYQIRHRAARFFCGPAPHAVAMPYSRL